MKLHTNAAKADDSYSSKCKLCQININAF